jgi:photosystem II stability/assembly factor-like uncharacterized protein
VKRIYLSLGIFVLIAVTFLVYFGNFRTGISSDAKAFTPEQLWEIQYQKKKERRKLGYNKADKPDLFTQYFKDITTPIGESKSGYLMNYKVDELRKARLQKGKLKSVKSELNFLSRGPANVGGRTRALLVDPDDTTHNTWFTGAASGGIWKTTDGGANWQNLTDQFTNLSVNAMAMAASNSNVIYAGTGESFPGGTYMVGNGIWKSVDKGINWVQLGSTAVNSNFAYVNRLIIDPTNPDIVLAATESGIYKTLDGGTTWYQVYSSFRGVEDLVEDMTNFSILFAGENGVGVLRSSDAGESWVISSTGMGEGGRFEIAVSKVNHNKVFASVDVSTEKSTIYISEDNGLTWFMFNDNQSFLGGQGMYDNTIEAHPFDENTVFVGGVDLWKVAFNGSVGETPPTVRKAYAENTDFLTFVDFGGKFLSGGLDTTEHVNRLKSDWVSVEIRFGVGLSQKAHRFTVPSQATSGVSAVSYSYKDYVEVPFQVWDVTNNKQLMVSFRDQEIDGAFNLYARTGDAYGQMGREYIFINAVAYSATTPNTNIAKSGGHQYKSLCMIWPGLVSGKSWNPENLPSSKIAIEYGTFFAYSGEKTSIADSYGNFDGPNPYNQSAGFGKTRIPGLHPDHHKLICIPTGINTFTLLNTNDGGIGISKDNGATFTMLLNNYITTQFYGVAKNPIANEYLGGMQDNGTWQSQTDENASVSSSYFFRLGGDGFECLWHAENPKLMLGSVYNNSIYKTTSSGSLWASSSEGIAEDDGPFITRLSASKQNPYVVFAVGATGVYKSTQFGGKWKLTTIPSKWSNGSLSSAANVEVSLANGNIVWAGSAMAGDNIKLHVSIDEGKTFTAVNNYSLRELSAYISGISTHPLEAETAYVLFSIKGAPKVLRTTDLGQTWEDISGFGLNSTSSNGFPDVVVQTLVVMPHNPNIIWVGTDIGLFESIDKGETWHMVQGDVPPVSIYDMHISGQQVVIATHGRGIWSIDIPEIENAPYIKNFSQVTDDDLSFNSNFTVAYEKVEVFADGELYQTLTAPITGDINLSIEKVGIQSANILGYINGKSYHSNSFNKSLSFTSIVEKKSGDTKFSVYPNPSKGVLNLRVAEKTPLDKPITMQVYNLSGSLVYSGTITDLDISVHDLTYLNTGTYLVQVKVVDKVYNQKILIQK